MEKITLLEGKRIVLGVTGSIAAYKAVDLASKLTQAGAQVDVIMSESAQRFVMPLSFQSVTGRPVYTDLWQSMDGADTLTHIKHVGLGEGADLLFYAPITAQSIAALAHGMADNLLTITALAARCPLLIAPAMDGGMFAHPATQANLETLRSRGVQIIDPAEGRFASGLVGKGRLPEVPELIGHARRVLALSGPLVGCRVVVTAGGTQEAMDPVRYLTNRSSGKQGYALAQAALDAGAEVTLISAASRLPLPVGAQVLPVKSAAEMLSAVLGNLDQTDALVMAAAVADFRPKEVAAQKIKKQAQGDSLTLELERNPDILLEVKARRAESGWPVVVIGFAAESEHLLANAQEKLAGKGLDLLAANDISAEDAGFGTDTNRVSILDSQGGQQTLDLLSKTQVSEILMARVAALLGRGS